MKKKLSLLLSLILCLSLFSYAFGTETERKMEFNTLNMTDEELAIYQKALSQFDAVIFYDRLMSSFVSSYGEMNGSPLRYPDNYAGAYINDDGKLVIQLKSNSDELSSENYSDYNIVDLEKLKKNNSSFNANSIEDIVIFEKVKYSLNDLNSLLEYSVNEITKDCKITGYGIDTGNNSVVIRFEPDIYEDVVKTIGKYKLKITEKYRDDYIDFEEIPLQFIEGGKNELLSNHIGGQGYYTHGGGGGVTLGFVGSYKEKLAYLTCGHGVNTGTAKYGGTAIGEVAAIRFNHNNYGDWSISYLNQGETTQGLIKQNASGSVVGKIAGRTNSLPKNTIVYHFGNTTKVWSSYEVIDINFTDTWNGKTIKELYTSRLKTGAFLASGDSGGPVVIPSGSNWYAVGTATGTTYDNNFAFSPMKHVPTDFYLKFGN